MNPSFKGRLIAGFILAFIAGAACGAFFGFHQARAWRAEFGHHPHAFADRIRNRIKSELDLTPEQLTKVEPVLNHADDELQKIRAETGLKVRQVATQTNRALEPLLTDAQRAKLQKIESRTLKKRGPHPPGRHREKAEGESTPDESEN
jgi:Spy/CpxP family protein refolding chaperone